MNHTNGHGKMSPLGEVLANAMKSLGTTLPETVQKTPVIHGHYDLGTLGVESALPLFMEANHVTA